MPDFASPSRSIEQTLFGFCKKKQSTLTEYYLAQSNYLLISLSWMSNVVDNLQLSNELFFRASVFFYQILYLKKKSDLPTSEIQKYICVAILMAADAVDEDYNLEMSDLVYFSKNCFDKEALDAAYHETYRLIDYSLYSLETIYETYIYSDYYGALTEHQHYQLTSLLMYTQFFYQHTYWPNAILLRAATTALSLPRFPIPDNLEYEREDMDSCISWLQRIIETYPILLPRELPKEDSMLGTTQLGMPELIVTSKMPLLGPEKEDKCRIKFTPTPNLADEEPTIVPLPGEKFKLVMGFIKARQAIFKNGKLSPSPFYHYSQPLLRQYVRQLAKEREREYAKLDSYKKDVLARDPDLAKAYQLYDTAMLAEGLPTLEAEKYHDLHRFLDSDPALKARFDKLRSDYEIERNKIQSNSSAKRTKYLIELYQDFKRMNKSTDLPVRRSRKKKRLGAS